MRTRKQEAVRFLDDYRNMRRQARIEAQRAARRAERKLLIEQAIIGVVMFIVLTIASGVLA